MTTTPHNPITGYYAALGRQADLLFEKDELVAKQDKNVEDSDRLRDLAILLPQAWKEVVRLRALASDSPEAGG